MPCCTASFGAIQILGAILTEATITEFGDTIIWALAGFVGFAKALFTSSV